MVKTRIFSKNDVSYGIYIYAFPVQQVLTLTGVNAIIPPAAFFVAPLTVTLVLAWASWKLLAVLPASVTIRLPEWPCWPDVSTI